MKKILTRSLATILILVIVFFSLGIIFPSVTYESKVTVNKSPETCFFVFANPIKLSDWLIGLKGISWISGFPNQVGSKWLFIVTRNGKDYNLVQTLKEFKLNEFYSANSDNEAFTNDVEVKFISKGNSTEIVSTSHLIGKNIFWRSAFVLAQFSIKGDDQKMYDKLKEVVEKQN